MIIDLAHLGLPPCPRPLEPHPELEPIFVLQGLPGADNGCDTFSHTTYSKNFPRLHLRWAYSADFLQSRHGRAPHDSFPGYYRMLEFQYF